MTPTKLLRLFDHVESGFSLRNPLCNSPRRDCRAWAVMPFLESIKTLKDLFSCKASANLMMPFWSWIKEKDGWMLMDEIRWWWRLKKNGDDGWMDFWERLKKTWGFCWLKNEKTRSPQTPWKTQYDEMSHILLMVQKSGWPPDTCETLYMMGYLHIFTMSTG